MCLLGRANTRGAGKTPGKYKAGCISEESEGDDDEEQVFRRPSARAAKKKPVLQLSSDDDSDFDTSKTAKGKCLYVERN